MKWKDRNKVNVDIVVNPNKDLVEMGNNSLNITMENGIKLEIPYDNTSIETSEKSVNFKKTKDGYRVKENKIK
jgi:hypothetical protein